MASIPVLLLFSSVLLFSLSTFPPLCSCSASVLSTPSTGHHALVVPIRKDPLANVYSIPLKQGRASFLLDIGGPLLWSACSAFHPTFPCNSKICMVARTFHNPICPLAKILPGPSCTCYATPVNPLTNKCIFADLTSTDVIISTTDGHNPTGSVTISGVTSSCASRAVLKSLPRGIAGVAGLARSGLALPAQFASKFSFKRQFAICLPSTSDATGVAFFGNPPFFFLAVPEFEATARLTYTKLKRNKMSPGYFLSLAGIAVGGQTVEFLQRVLDFDSLGHGGVKLSTVTPYTVLHRHIYLPFLKAYARATSGIPRAPKVAPFDLCLKSSALGSTRMGYGVPQIDLMLVEGRNWTMFGANILKQVDAGTACLAFVDGGPKAERAVVVGAFQMEDNFLLVDVARSRLGFTSSLLGVRTTCANFNFTTAAN
ncbi:hypothetical protein Taro_023789 [Colocasia esculenta]|uniref:Peptidase A1 domain-containing protein n=1 Tax=Colocasia esculenta TaxID=4460 RepID=A0A843V5L5_COLES|nr:hypothetical protein [Colocasia esculenta]